MRKFTWGKAEASMGESVSGFIQGLDVQDPDPIFNPSDGASGQDHKDLHKDFEPFPYRIFHGNIDARILNRVKDCPIAEQVPLSVALSTQKVEDLEIAFFRDNQYALEVCKITGDLISLLLGVNVARLFRSDMTLLQFVEAFTLVDTAPELERKHENHPDALGRIVRSLESWYRALL